MRSPPGDPPDTGTEFQSPALADGFFTTSAVCETLIGYTLT